MKKISKLVTKLRRLRGDNIFLLMAAFVLLGVIRLGLWLIPFHLLFKFFRWFIEASHFLLSKFPTDPHFVDMSPSLLKSCGQFSQISSQSRTVTKIVWSINVASHYMPGKPKCLARALATQVLMNWHRYVSELRIGVDKTPTGEFRAHAWIEYQGHVIIGNLGDLAQFTPLLAYRGIKQ